MIEQRPLDHSYLAKQVTSSFADGIMDKRITYGCQIGMGPSSSQSSNGRRE